MLRRRVEFTLAAAVGVMDQAAVALGLPGVQRLLQRVEHEVGVHRELLTRQPTMRRAKTSMTKATYSQPCKVET